MFGAYFQGVRRSNRGGEARDLTISLRLVGSYLEVCILSGGIGGVKSCLKRGPEGRDNVLPKLQPLASTLNGPLVAFSGGLR